MQKRPLYIRIDDVTELKLLIEQDAPAIFHLIDTNRKHLRAWLPWIDYTQSVEDEKVFIRSTLAQYQEQRSITCTIWYKGEIAGTIGYHPFDWANRKVEIGYWLAAQFQGQGLMTKACQTMIAYAFKELRLNKVEIRCATSNTRSCAIPIRLGFTQEGIIRQAEWLYTHYVDLRLYGLLVDEWKQLQTKQ
jgi:ribosomal-protein-serine acetyltransferase